MGDDGMGGDFGGTDGVGLGMGGIGDGLGNSDFGGAGFGNDGLGANMGDYGGSALGGDIGSFFGGPDTGLAGMFGQDAFGFAAPSLTGEFGSSASYGGYGGIGMGGLGMGIGDSLGTDAGSFGGGGSFAESLQSFLSTPIGKGLMGIIGIANPALGAALGIGKMGLAAATGKGGAAMGGALGGQIGSTLGSALGPIGSMAGGMLGSSVGANALNGVSGQQGDIGGMQGQGGMGEALTSLAGLYAASRGGDSAKRQQQNLERLFTPDSPYAQQMRQRLERRDAAAGRRSQYGSREVELAAKLAELNARTAPQIQQLSQQRDQERNRKIAAGLMLAKNSGLFDGLGSMFGGGSSGAMF